MEVLNHIFELVFMIAVCLFMVIEIKSQKSFEQRLGKVEFILKNKHLFKSSDQVDDYISNGD